MSGPAADAPVEVLRPDFPRGEFRAAMFDFDGTLSLIRRNWQGVMIPMMVDVLRATGSGESNDQLHERVEEFVMRLNGKQTIYQMIQLAEEVTARGGTPRDPLDYKNQYHDLLMVQVNERLAHLHSGQIASEELTVPGSRELLEALRSRGIELFLASGTDLKYVREEVELLGFTEFFGPHIYGALDDYRNFSKAMIIERMIRDMGVGGHQLLAFGDGFVEIQETRKAGGVAIGVASEEVSREGINEWKRQRLINAGADIIVGDYRRLDELLAVLGV
jgi:beta-phosphoglucomutase-like phosphatase (HAD superfamily)